MSTTASSDLVSFAPTLRSLYFTRFGFAIVWAILLGLTGTSFGPIAVVLLVIYPVFDLAAAVIDHRASRATRPGRLLLVNMALSLLAAIGIAIAATYSESAVLVVWGVWAITAGAVQLAVAIARRSLGGQWPMILAGGISVLAGSAFIVMAGDAAPSVVGLAGYATLGAIFFLISAIRLQRTITKTSAR